MQTSTVPRGGPPAHPVSTVPRGLRSGNPHVIYPSSKTREAVPLDRPTTPPLFWGDATVQRPEKPMGSAFHGADWSHSCEHKNGC
jgi:hypothetical protein